MSGLVTKVLGSLVNATEDELIEAMRNPHTSDADRLAILGVFLSGRSVMLRVTTSYSADHTEPKFFNRLVINWPAGGLGNITIDGVPYDATMSGTVVFEKVESGSDVVIAANANTYYVTRS